MPDVFFKAKRSEVMARIRSQGNKDTEIAVACGGPVSEDGVMKPDEYFERRQDICGGALVVKGTRVLVRTLLASLAEGSTVEEIRADYPTVSDRALHAVIAFAAASAIDDLPVPGIPVAA